MTAGSTPQEDVWKSVYRDDRVWYNVMENCLWEKKIFCLLGFDDEIDSGKDLILLLIDNLVSRGASILKFPNKNLDNRLIHSVDFFLCNYALGYQSRPTHTLESRFVTPIWLYTCNRDGRIYESDHVPIFRAVDNFYALKFLKSKITVSVFGALEGNPNATNGDETTNFDLDTLSRFIRHCGFNFVDYRRIKHCDPNSKIYFILCKALDKEVDDELVKFSAKYKIPCLSVEWLFDSYQSGELEKIENYAVNLQLSDCSNVSLRKRKRGVQRSAQTSPMASNDKVVCFSFAAALDHEGQMQQLRDLGINNVFVVNPIYVLAPWAADNTLADHDRQMYNSIGLLPSDKVLLLLSKTECQDNAIGLFAELSLLLKDKNASKRGKVVRNVEIRCWSEERESFTQGVIDIPPQLLKGNSLVDYIKGNNCVNTFDLYDLAESITFAEAETLSQYHEEAMEETNRALHASAFEFSKTSRDSEMRWRSKALSASS